MSILDGRDNKRLLRQEMLAKQCYVVDVDGELMLYNKETGEFYDIHKSSNIRVDRNGNVTAEIPCNDEDIVKRITPEQRSYMKNKSDMGKMTSDLGGFYMLYYNERLFDGLVSDTHIARVIYLATFIEYDTNRLVFYENGKANVPFTERDVKEILGIKKVQTYNEFKKEILDSGIMTITDDGIFMNKKYFNRGEVQHKGYFMRMYIDTIRQLYEQINTRQHKTLGYLFRLIPFIDYEYNIITRSPNTDDKIKERLMTKKDIAQLFNVDLETYKKVEQQLLRLTITFRDKKYPLLGAISIKALDIETDRVRKTNCYVVNPLIYSSISDYSTIDKINKELWLKL